MNTIYDPNRCEIDLDFSGILEVDDQLFSSIEKYKNVILKIIEIMEKNRGAPLKYQTFEKIITYVREFEFPVNMYIEVPIQENEKIGEYIYKDCAKRFTIDSKKGQDFMSIDLNKDYFNTNHFYECIGDEKFMINFVAEHGENIHILDIRSFESDDFFKIFCSIKAIIDSIDNVIREKKCEKHRRAHEKMIRKKFKKPEKEMKRYASTAFIHVDIKMLNSYVCTILSDVIYKLYGVRVNCSLKTYKKLLWYYCDKFLKKF